MRLVRRRFLQLAGAAAVATAPRSAAALDYPTRPVRIIVGKAAGSTVDFLARLMGQWLGDRLGQLFVVENRPGAGGNIGAETLGIFAQIFAHRARDPAASHGSKMVTSSERSGRGRGLERYPQE